MDASDDEDRRRKPVRFGRQMAARDAGTLPWAPVVVEVHYVANDTTPYVMWGQQVELRDEMGGPELLVDGGYEVRYVQLDLWVGKGEQTWMFTTRSGNLVICRPLNDAEMVEWRAITEPRVAARPQVRHPPGRGAGTPDPRPEVSDSRLALEPFTPSSVNTQTMAARSQPVAVARSRGTARSAYRTWKNVRGTCSGPASSPSSSRCHLVALARPESRRRYPSSGRSGSATATGTRARNARYRGTARLVIVALRAL